MLKGHVSIYGLPEWVGGVISSLEGAPTGVRAILKGEEIGSSNIFETTDGEGQFSFKLMFSRPVSHGVIRSGLLRISVTFDDVVWSDMEFWSVLTGVDGVFASLEELKILRKQLGPDFVSVVQRIMEASPELKNLFGSGPRPLLAPGFPDYSNENLNQNGTAKVLFPVGLASPDGSSFLGRDGYAFLYAGSNRLQEQKEYGIDDPRVVSTGAQWCALLEERNTRCESMNCSFIQLILPEKSTILSDYVPVALGIGGQTSLLSFIERRCVDASFYMSGTSILSRLEPSEVFRKLDSHLTPMGAWYIADAILQKRGFGEKSPTFNEICYMHADLADRFFDVRPVDFVLAAAPECVSQYPRRKVSEIVPDSSRHKGRSQVWVSEKSLSSEKVVVFGNSFVSFADEGQCYISFWLSHWFREFHFVWDAALDWSYVEKIKPDLVITQTIERFLITVPEQ